MIAGFAGGIQPWWHHVGAYHEDRRMYRTAEPLMRWYKANEQYLVNRRPVAAVGLVWSQRNTDFYGRDNADELVDAPYRGFMQALVRARIPYIPVHADHIERDAGNLGVLILPNLGAMSDAQCAAVRRFVEKGGGLIAIGCHQPIRRMGRLARRLRAGRSVRRARRRQGAGRAIVRGLPTPICGSHPSCAPASGGRRPATNRRPPASATPFCAVSRRPISCPSAASWNPSRRTRA